MFFHLLAFGGLDMKTPLRTRLVDWREDMQEMNWRQVAGQMLGGLLLLVILYVTLKLSLKG